MRNSHCLSFFLSTIFCSLLLSQFPPHCAAQENNQPKDILRIGYSYRFFADINPEDAKAATKTWIDTILKNKGIHFDDSMLTIYKSIDEMARAIELDQVEILTLHSLDYLELKARGVKISPDVTGIRESDHANELVLIVRREASNCPLKDLQGKTMLIDESKGLDLPGMWLDTLLFGQGLCQGTKFFGVVKRVNKVTQAVMPVFFKQADACVTSYSAYLTAVELNPQLGKTLAVHSVSPPLLPAVLCFRENYTDPRRGLLVQSICELNQTVTGRQILTIFRSDKGIPFETAHIENVAKLLENYQNIKSGKRAVASNH